MNRAVVLLSLLLGVVLACSNENEIGPPFDAVLPECADIHASTVSYTVPALEQSLEINSPTQYQREQGISELAERFCKGQIVCQDCGYFRLSMSITTVASAEEASRRIREEETNLPGWESNDSNHEFSARPFDSDLSDERLTELLSYHFEGWDIGDNLKDNSDEAFAFEEWMGFRGTRLVFSIDSHVVALEARAMSRITFSRYVGVTADVDASIPDDMLADLALALLQRWPSPGNDA
jgi:hypothetical protein